MNKINSLFGNGMPEEYWRRVFDDISVPVYIEDITEVNKAISAILASGVTDFSSWLSAHPDFVLQAVGMVNILDVNAAAVETSRAKNKVDLMVSIEQMIMPETLVSFRNIILALANGDEYFEGEVHSRKLDGGFTRSWCRSNLPKLDADPAILVFTNTDISKIKNRYQAIEHSEKHYRKLVEAAGDIVLCHDLSGKISYVNHSGLRFLGWTATGQDDRYLRDLVPEYMREQIELSNSLRPHQDPDSLLYEIVFVTANGSEIPVEISSSVVSHSVIGIAEPQVMVIARDISERRLIELEQRQDDIRRGNAQKMESLSLLARGLANDFNNVLAQIVGNAELIQKDLADAVPKTWPDVSPISEGLNAILAAAGNAAELCQKIQVFGKTGPFQPELLDLNILISGVSSLLQASVPSKADIQFSYAGNISSVLAVPVQLQQVLVNLVTNAVESLPKDGGLIDISTGSRHFTARELNELVAPSNTPAGEYVYFEVKDDGCGMDNQVRNRIFEPFFTTKAAGRGLCLSTSLGFIHAHNGGFLVNSEPGVGTTITVLLPEHQTKSSSRPARKTRTRQPDQYSKNLKDKTVLIVDDDPAVRRVGESYLRRIGSKVLSVADGFAAVLIFGQRYSDIDVVLIDFAMAGMDGIATCRRMRVICPDIPIVLCSGFCEQDVMDKATGIEIDGFVPKPYRLVQIAEVLGKVLEDS